MIDPLYFLPLPGTNKNLLPFPNLFLSVLKKRTYFLFDHDFVDYFFSIWTLDF